MLYIPLAGGRARVPRPGPQVRVRAWARVPGAGSPGLVPESGFPGPGPQVRGSGYRGPGLGPWARVPTAGHGPRVLGRGSPGPGPWARRPQTRVPGLPYTPGNAANTCCCCVVQYRCLGCNVGKHTFSESTPSQDQLTSSSQKTVAKNQTDSQASQADRNRMPSICHPWCAPCHIPVTLHLSDPSKAGARNMYFPNVYRERFLKSNKKLCS